MPRRSPSSSRSATPPRKALTVEEEFAQAAQAGAASAQAGAGRSPRQQQARPVVKRKTPGSDDDAETAQPVAKKTKRTASHTVRPAAATVAVGPTTAPNEEVFAAACALLSLSYAVVAPAPTPAPLPAPMSHPPLVSRSRPRIMTPHDRATLQLATRLRPTGPAAYYYTAAVNAAREAATVAAARAAPTYGQIREDAIIDGKYNPSDPTINLAQMKLKSADAIDDVLAIYGRDPELWDSDVRRLFSAADRRVTNEAKQVRDAAKREQEEAQRAEASNARAARAAARRQG